MTIKALILPVAVGTVVSFISIAGATVGEPTLVKVLGFEPREGKIFYFIDQGYGTCLHLMRAKGPNVGRSELVKSYYPAGKCFADQEAPKQTLQRIQRLRRRLVPLTVLERAKRPKDDTTLPRKIRALKLQRKVLKRWRDKDFDTPCRRVALTLSYPPKGLKGTLTLKACGPRARATALFSLPKRTELLALVSAKPNMFEGGYEEQYPVLLRSRK